MDLHTGQLILNGKYRIQGRIGEGAFAEVYLAAHLELGVHRAVKLLRRDAPGVGTGDFADWHRRFQLEAQLGARLSHPHVIQVHDFEQEGDTLALVMEYARGGSLAERIAWAQAGDQRLPVEEVVAVALDVAEGLAALHEKLTAVHRDLKPSNVLLDADGRAKVADLGLAQVPGWSTRSLGQGRPHPGTPAYMSPEQATSFDYLPPASDVYSLGLVLFEMLTGQLYKHLRPGTRIRASRADAPAWLDDLVARMLAQDPRDRPWDGSEVAAELRKAGVEAPKKPAEAQPQSADGGGPPPPDEGNGDRPVGGEAVARVKRPAPPGPVDPGPEGAGPARRPAPANDDDQENERKTVAAERARQAFLARQERERAARAKRKREEEGMRAEREDRLHDLFHRAMDAGAAGDWASMERLLAEVVELGPYYSHEDVGAREMLAEAKKMLSAAASPGGAPGRPARG